MIYVSVNGNVATVDIDGVKGTGKIVSKEIRADRHIEDDEIIHIGDREYSVDVYVWYGEDVQQEVILIEWEGWTTLQDGTPVRHGRNVLSVTTTLATEGQQ